MGRAAHDHLEIVSQKLPSEKTAEDQGEVSLTEVQDEPTFVLPSVLRMFGPWESHTCTCHFICLHTRPTQTLVSRTYKDRERERERDRD